MGYKAIISDFDGTLATCDKRVSAENLNAIDEFLKIGGKFALCTGTNSLPTIKSLQSLQHLPEFILSWPDNDDWYYSKYNKFEMERRDLMEHLRDKDRQYYYDSVLVPMPKTTLKDFL